MPKRAKRERAAWPWAFNDRVMAAADKVDRRARRYSPWRILAWQSPSTASTSRGASSTGDVSSGNRTPLLSRRRRRPDIDVRTSMLLRREESQSIRGSQVLASPRSQTLPHATKRHLLSAYIKSHNRLSDKLNWCTPLRVYFPCMIHPESDHFLNAIAMQLPPSSSTCSSSACRKTSFECCIPASASAIDVGQGYAHSENSPSFLPTMSSVIVTSW